MRKRPDLAVVTGKLYFKELGKDKADEVLRAISPRLRMLNPTIAPGYKNRNSLISEVSYGPVRGCYPHDIKRMARQALIKAKTTATIDFKDYKRTPVR